MQNILAIWLIAGCGVLGGVIGHHGSLALASARHAHQREGPFGTGGILGALCGVLAGAAASWLFIL